MATIHLRWVPNDAKAAERTHRLEQIGAQVEVKGVE